MYIIGEDDFLLVVVVVGDCQVALQNV